MKIARFVAGVLLVIGTLAVMVGGSALDSESLVIPMVLCIVGGIVMAAGTVGFKATGGME